MPKMKTHKGVKKRFRLTGTGKVKHRQSGTSHRQSRMDTDRRRKLKGNTLLDTSMVAMIKRALGKYSY